MKVSYNSPVILTFAIIAAGVLAWSRLGEQASLAYYFSAPIDLEQPSPLTYVRLFSHIIGHADWNHYISNFTFIFLLGPTLEEKYSSSLFIVMIAVTAFITGILNAVLFSTSILGASGIVFMLIILSSFANAKDKGTIPLTFILVALLFLGREVLNALNADQISQFAHIMGGLCGAIFGFYLAKIKK